MKQYDRAIELNSSIAEAFFNRGLALSELGDKAGASVSLSKAGELGLYDAYSVLKQLNQSKSKAKASDSE